MNPIPLARSLVLALLCAGAHAAGVAWLPAAGDAEVDAAFARARAEHKPVLLYWGAKWCPPCNQLQATVFNRQDFIERTRGLVPVYVDGDKPGAQKLGSRFAVRGYPTLVLFDAQGRELTRVPGEVDPAQVGALITLGLAARRPVPELLAAARAGGAGLTPDDWQLLAFYPWNVAAQPPAGGLAATLRDLAAACPATQPDPALRLGLQAALEHDRAARRDPKAAPALLPEAPARRVALLALLADPARSRAFADLLGAGAPRLVRALSAPGSAERTRLVVALDEALRRQQDDAALSRADRAVALYGRVKLVDVQAADDTPVPAPAALRDEVRAQAARFDREITDAYERQAVVTTSAWVLAQAGLADESDTLLKANLARSHSPYYLMADLAENAKQRGDTAAALDWSTRAWEASVGPATRLQWGAMHLALLVELAPDDAARIEALVARLVDEAAAAPDAFDGRSGRSLQRAGQALLGWAKAGRHEAVLRRLQARLDPVCRGRAAGSPARSACEGVLRAPAAAGVSG